MSVTPGGKLVARSATVQAYLAEHGDDANALPPNTLAATAPILPGDGGTSDILPMERAKASFNTETLIKIMDGGEDYTTQRRFIMDGHSGAEQFTHAEMDREDLIAHSITHFMDVHGKYLKTGYKPKDMDMTYMSDARMTSSVMSLHFGVFSSTLRSQCSDDQKKWWLEPAQRGEIVGCYSQTELAHGSNVRGLKTEARLDLETDEWVLHTPDVGATKWWATGLTSATHSIVFAQLYTPDGVCHGLHMLFVQLRGPDLAPLPGLELGDVGRLAGENDCTVGYLRFDHLRIPRRHLLERRQHVDENGTFVAGPPPDAMDAVVVTDGGQKAAPIDPKIAQAVKYVTMMKTRIALASTAAGALAKGCIIGARYSCVRHQGFKDRAGPGNNAHLGPENQIMDYSVQRYRVLKWTATAYAIRSATRWMVDRRHEVEAKAKGDDAGMDSTDALLDDLPELHATGAGLKALCCVLAADGIEDLRRACGGHGFLMSSGIAPLEQDYKGPNTTAEGDYVLLSLQTARYLMKSLDAARRGEPLAGLTAGLAGLSDPAFSPLKNGRKMLELPETAGSFEEISSPEFLEKLFQWRSLVCITRVGAALDKARAEGGLSETEAWNASARLLYTTASCHVRYFLIQKFAAVAKAAPDAACKLVLQRMVALFGLSDILEGEQWLGLITAEEAAFAEVSFLLKTVDFLVKNVDFLPGSEEC